MVLVFLVFAFFSTSHHTNYIVFARLAPSVLYLRGALSHLKLKHSLGHLAPLALVLNEAHTLPQLCLSCCTLHAAVLSGVKVMCEPVVVNDSMRAAHLML
jgi:hypothetical protein